MAARKTAAAGAKRNAPEASSAAPPPKKARAPALSPPHSPVLAAAKEKGRARKAPPPKKAPAKKAAKSAAATTNAAAPSENGLHPTTTTTKMPVRKRKADDDISPAAKKSKALVKGPVINEPPTERINVYVFGEGSSGELGLGTDKKSIDVKRPRLNPLLAADKVGVTKVVAGGMHALALTHDNKILSWGVNDQGALGRDTQWEGGLRDMDAAEDSDSDDSGEDNGINPRECNPAAVDWSQTEVADGTRFADLAAGDSSSFALTDDGRVYGWGTFRKADGIFGFTAPKNVITRPVLIQGLPKITSIVAGANHVIALDHKGGTWAWGAGQQMQLGRRIIERNETEGLIPRQFGLPKGPKNGITAIATGNDHSFAVSRTGAVYAWGCNTFGETGIAADAGQSNAAITNPTVIASLKGKTIVSIKGGVHHTVAATQDGACLVWGRADCAALGIEPADMEKLPADAVIRDPKSGRVRIVMLPQVVEEIDEDVVRVGASGDNSIAVTKDGKAYSWGFSTNYQTGQGTDEDVEVATLIDNTAVRGKRILGAECGGQFSIVYGAVEAPALTNGV